MKIKTRKTKKNIAMNIKTMTQEKQKQNYRKFSHLNRVGDNVSNIKCVNFGSVVFED